ncbi:MAG TPA: hypothetical protein VJA40_02775 [archaeon]|nr:hypothetical protein [archaeon]
MKAYVVGSWKGENYESFLEVQRILELAGYEVLKQQDLVGKKLKPEEAIVKKEQLLGVSDFVVRLWTEDLPKDENAASRLVSPILEKGKLLVTIIVPPTQRDALPECVKANSKYIFDLSDFEQPSHLASALKFIARDLEGGGVFTGEAE